ARNGDAPSARTKKQLQTELARHKICEAVIECLDAFGYAETSINRVQERARVSRGALTHHFPSKEELMVATVERLLEPVRGPAGRKGAKPQSGWGVTKSGGVERDLIRLWDRVVNTKEGRALVEILVAARTDRQLHTRISPKLSHYNDEFNREVLKLYRSDALDDDDVVELWTICRVFLRGLHIQERFETKPGRTSNIMKRFAQIIGPHLSAREPG
ncbi:MAG: TetR/AcrR family transcriptional regulator, partial [Hyphomicrobiales bacterium]